MLFTFFFAEVKDRSGITTVSSVGVMGVANGHTTGVLISAGNSAQGASSDAADDCYSSRLHSLITSRNEKQTVILLVLIAVTVVNSLLLVALLIVVWKWGRSVADDYDQSGVYGLEYTAKPFQAITKAPCQSRLPAQSRCFCRLGLLPLL